MASQTDICNLALMRIGIRNLIAQGDTTSTINAQLAAALFPQLRDQLLQLYPWKFATKRQVLAVKTLGDSLGSYETRSGWAFMYLTPTDMIEPRYLWGGGLTPTNTNQVQSPAWPPLPQLTPRVPIPSQKIPYDLEQSDDASTTFLLTDLNDTSQPLTTNGQSTGTPIYGIWVSGQPQAAGLIVNWDGSTFNNINGPYYICIVPEAVSALPPPINPTHWLLLQALPPAALLVYTMQVTNTGAYPPLFRDALAWALARDLVMALKVDGQDAKELDGKYDLAWKRAAVADAQGSLDYEPDSEFISFRE